MLKDRIVSDLKTAMLSGDKQRAEALKLLKSAILYKEVETGVRETGLDDQTVITILTKEAKKRSEAAVMYQKGDHSEQAQQEQYEHDLIQEYLPAQLTDEELARAVQEVISQAGEVTSKDMGRLIGLVKNRVGAGADGGRIATAVKKGLKAE